MSRARGEVVWFPAAPAWFGLTAIGLSAFAGLALVGRPTGLGLSLLLLGVLSTAAGAAGGWARFDRWTRAWWVLAALLALMPALRTANWVVVLSVAGTLALAVVATGQATTWSRALLAPLGWLGALVPGPLLALAGAGRGASSAVLRGLVGALLLVALFGSLLAAADAAFAELTSGLVPDLDHGEARLWLAVLVLGACGALLSIAALPAPEIKAAPEPVLGRAETRIALGALLALFVVFIGVQAATLFGGDAFVQRTADLTYAQYARSGFTLLLLVAALVLATLAAAARWARPDRWLQAALCAATLVILAAALHRLQLYTDAYGATREREFARWSIIWLAGLFALVLARRTAVPQAVITWSAVLGVCFGLSNPDARVAAGTDDPAYLRGLSEDAAGVTGECVDRGGGLWSLTLAEIRYPCASS